MQRDASAPLDEWIMAVNGTLAAAADRVEFDRWYDEVHLPEVLACPGFRWGRRYLGVPAEDGTPFLTLYGIAGPEALDSPELAAVRGFGPFTADVTFVTRAYRQSAHARDVVERRR
ncbi:hypothetical protein [Conexibacter arvalis]|uniref:Uncharacterized protein n=1 Tax=Conexibacter arvalis TaxID=912552 RepID=A0A840I7X9_9ACTN|nr:hypothetical protein [Conexibacter arvalis]MBB4660435.1 hypothetical protein [Conexibacter arvalis]